jgi:acetoin utilization deacetylase AcuC-like enzyme
VTIAFWSELQRLHDPAGEVWLGIRIPGTEVPDRADLLRDAVTAAGVSVGPPERHDRAALETVHEPELLDFLATAWRRWIEAGYPDEPGMDRVVAYTFPHAGFRPAPRRPVAASALTGMYATDTATLIGPGTWEAAEAAAWCALSAATAVASGRHKVAIAATRPPGHHAGRRFYGGSCYLNNAALAAQRLIDAGVRSVAVVDLDAHHGNGTQEIFWERSDVRYGSVHVDPAFGWFPHFVGFADEIGEAEGTGATFNVPLIPGTGDSGWLDGVRRVAEFASGAEALVISLGVDAAAADPESPLAVSQTGYSRAGGLLADLGIPSVIVFEGGYHLPTLAGLMAAFIEGTLEER